MEFERYSTTPYSYWARAKDILGRFEQSRHTLFYAAYELRCAIEAFLFDYLDFLRDGDLSKNLRKLYLATDLRAKILEMEPHFEKRIEFDNLIHKAIGLDVVQIAVPDLTSLGCLYGKIGAYMHIKKDTMDNAEWSKLEQLVKETQTVLHDLVHPQKSLLELTDDGVALFELFRTGKSNADAIISAVSEDPKKYFYKAKYLM